MAAGVNIAIRADTAFVEIGSTASDLRTGAASRLDTCLGQIAADDSVRFVVLRGADLELAEDGDAPIPTDELSPEQGASLRRAALRLRMTRQIVVAGLRGAGVGATASVALAADIVVAEQSARLRFPVARRGAGPGLHALIGSGKSAGQAVARDLLLTGRSMTAGEAVARGLVSRLCPDGELHAALEGVLTELRVSSPAVLALTKAQIDDQLAATRRLGPSVTTDSRPSAPGHLE